MKVLIDLFFVFFRIGAFTFGGGYAMIPLIQRDVVEVKGWLDLDEFVDIIAIAESTPGPVAINAATYVGKKVYGLIGSLVATIGVALPSVFIIILIASLFVKFREIELVTRAFMGIRPVVVALIVGSGITLGRKLLTERISLVMAVAALAAGLILRIHPIVLLALGGAAGLVLFGESRETKPEREEDS